MSGRDLRLAVISKNCVRANLGGRIPARLYGAACRANTQYRFRFRVPLLENKIKAMRYSRIVRWGGTARERFSFVHRRFAEFFAVCAPLKIPKWSNTIRSRKTPAGEMVSLSTAALRLTRKSASWPSLPGKPFWKKPKFSKREMCKRQDLR